MGTRQRGRRHCRRGQAAHSAASRRLARRSHTWLTRRMVGGPSRPRRVALYQKRTLSAAAEVSWKSQAWREGVPSHRACGNGGVSLQRSMPTAVGH